MHVLPPKNTILPANWTQFTFKQYAAEAPDDLFILYGPPAPVEAANTIIREAVAAGHGEALLDALTSLERVDEAIGARWESSYEVIRAMLGPNCVQRSTEIKADI